MAELLKSVVVNVCVLSDAVSSEKRSAKDIVLKPLCSGHNLNDRIPHFGQTGAIRPRAAGD